MGVLHRCDTPRCCNPAHLFLGTQLDNIADATAKGRVAQGERHYNAQLTAEAVQRIRAIPHKAISYTALAQEYGVSKHAIADLRRRKPRNWRRVLGVQS
jgi:predicted amino acid dehydrogenase